MLDLKDILQKEIGENRERIQEEISSFEDKKLIYRNIELNKNLCLILKNNGNEKLMLVGFPFPLKSYLLTGFNIRKETLVFIFLKGTPLRSCQREVLLNELKELRETEYTEVNSHKEFRRITKILCKKFKKVDYYDPYSFIGDSFIGLHFIESFIKRYKLKVNNIYSENYKFLSIVSIVAKTKGYVGSIPKKKHILNIFADLIDNQWDRTKYLVKSFAKQNLPSIICGRDLIVIPYKDKIKIYHFNRVDVLLRKENIEDYMNKCLLPFLNPIKNSFKLNHNNTKNILINPFGSEASKTIPWEIILEVSRHFNEFYPDSKILLLSGFKNSYPQLLWVSRLKGILSEYNLKNVLFKNYGSFEEIKKDISRYDFSLGITTDTSIAHLFNYLGLRNLTFFNLDRCDLKSPQSLSSDGPIGFCRYGKVQYPAIYLAKDQSKLTKGILQAINYFFGNNKSLGWCNLVFDKKILISKISTKDNPDIIRANIRINPIYKLKND